MLQLAATALAVIYAVGIVSLIAGGLLSLAFPGFRAWLTGQPARSRWSYEMPDRRQHDRGIARRSDNSAPETSAAMKRNRVGAEAGSIE